MQQETKTCQNCKNQFTIEPEDFQFYEKISVPPPTFCPSCRFQRRLAFRNEMALYRRKCDLCGQIKVSNFSPAYSYPVYCPTCWWSDKWDSMSYGRDFNPEKNFLEQFIELRNDVPQQGLAVEYDSMVNSEFCHMANHLKNCYMVTHSNDGENCFYSSATIGIKDSGELLSCVSCELCLENINCQKCNQVYFSIDCENCFNVVFSRDCVGCSYCFGCTNLRNKKYHVFNESFSKEEYFEKLKELDIGSRRAVAAMFEKTAELWKKYPQKYIHGRHITNVSGDYIYDSKNSSNCFDVLLMEDSKYCHFASRAAQCYDYAEWGAGAELIYECMNVGKMISNIKFSQQSWENSRNQDYTSFCISSADLFGCVSLRNKQYCILNKQYSKEDYKKLCEIIIASMNDNPFIDKKGRIYRYGEFLPIELSFWGYNETSANEHFPLTKDQAEAAGYRWADIDKYKGVYQSTLKADEIPDHIADVTASILDEIIECSVCRKPYRIVKQEFDFYKRQKIALPGKCHDCRYNRRFTSRNPFKLYGRKCDCSGKSAKNAYENGSSHFHGDEPCPNEFETSYAPERPEIVYCEQCYNSEVV